MDKTALLKKLQQIKESTKQIMKKEERDDGETSTDVATNQD